MRWVKPDVSIGYHIGGVRVGFFLHLTEMFDLIVLMSTNNQQQPMSQNPNIPAKAEIPQPVNTVSQESFIEPKKSKLIFKILLPLSVIIVVLLVYGVWVYLKHNVSPYLDSKYGFIIRNQKDWCSAPLEKGVYYGVATFDSPNCKYGKAVSTFGLSPIKHTGGVSGDLEVYKKTCLNAAKEFNITTHGTSNIRVNNLHGIVCVGEGKPLKVDKTYIFKQYWLLNNKGQYDYVISISYPKGDVIEEEKVRRILNSLSAK